MPRLTGIPPVMEGVRVGADEVIELKSRFRVKEVPAVLLLDRAGAVVCGWQGSIPSNLWALLQAHFRRLERLDREFEKQAGEAARFLEAGSFEAAYRAAAPLAGSPRVLPSTRELAREIERKCIAAGDAQLYRILAREGLAADSVVRASLEKLRNRTPHPPLRERAAREALRLAETRPAGKS
ncbi:MAG TPA: hypothetical protein VMT52_09980 [Planctomycetota bacterium]|nr:hypothetical protein [Planctomycetota bacterium]